MTGKHQRACVSLQTGSAGEGCQPLSEMVMLLSGVSSTAEVQPEVWLDCGAGHWTSVNGLSVETLQAFGGELDISNIAAELCPHNAA